MRRIILFPVFFLTLIGCTNSSNSTTSSTICNSDTITYTKTNYPEQTVNKPDLAPYVVEQVKKGTTVYDSERIEYVVRIETELSKKALDDIADELKAQTSDETPYVFVAFYLPKMTVGQGNYATAFRTPTQIDLRINPRPSSIAKQTAPSESSDREILGKWDLSYGITTIYKKKGVVYMEDTYNDGSTSIYKLVKRTRFGRTGYMYAEDGRELYVISDGYLYMYDEFGDFGGRLSPL